MRLIAGVPVTTVLVAAALFAPGSARGDDPGTDLVAIRPGVMCASAAALASLTLSTGDSRTHAASPRPQDLALARQGGCNDVTLGRAVLLRTPHHNTSVVTQGDPSAPMVIANIDFQPLADPAPAGRDGYRRTQHVATGASDGGALEVLEDDRISPALRRQMWGVAEDPDFVLPAGSPLSATFRAHPLRPARLRLLDGAGTVLAEQVLDRPQAIVWPAPLRGLPAPGFMLTVDRSIGMGSYAGPGTTLLLPSLHRLAPERAIAADGTPTAIDLADTLKTAWTVVPARDGAGDEIELVACRPVGPKPNFVTTYSTYRLVAGGGAGQWHVASRREPGIWENEGFPGRSAFP